MVDIRYQGMMVFKQITQDVFSGRGLVWYSDQSTSRVAKSAQCFIPQLSLPAPLYFLEKRYQEYYRVHWGIMDRKFCNDEGLFLWNIFLLCHFVPLNKDFFLVEKSKSKTK